MKIKEYSWWGESNEPPSNLKTKRQLAELGLKPKNAIGIIKCKKYDVYLYDPENPDSAVAKRKCSEAQLKALEKARVANLKNSYYHERRMIYEYFIPDHNSAIEWARKVLSEKDKYIILDTETTGLYDAEIVQVGVCNIDGEVILDFLVKPTITIPNEVIGIHGITNEMVINAPTFPEVYPKIVKAAENRTVLIYNREFDITILKYCTDLHNLPSLKLSKRSDCIMNWYAQYHGEWNDYYRSYTWQKLNGGHNAVSDCLAALKLIVEMAKDELIDAKKSFESDWLQYCEHITKQKIPDIKI